MSGSDRPRATYTLRILPSAAPDRARRREQAAKLLLGLLAEAGAEAADPVETAATDPRVATPPRVA